MTHTNERRPPGAAHEVGGPDTILPPTAEVGREARTLDAASARALIDSAKADLGAGFTKVSAASLGRAWEALGYASWADLCSAEFTDVTSLALPPGDRRDEVVAELQAAGLSVRDIAAATSLSKSTVARALAVPDGTATPVVDPTAADNWEAHLGQPDGWRPILDHALRGCDSHMQFVVPATIGEAVRELRRISAVQSAGLAAACWGAVEHGVLDPDPTTHVSDILDLHEDLHRWPVVAAYLRQINGHGVDVRAEYATWARDEAADIDDADGYTRLAAVGSWVDDVLAAVTA